MLFNYYEAEQVMQEQMRDRLREAEQARLIQATQDPRESQGWWRLVTLVPMGLLSIFIPILKVQRADQPRAYALGKASHSTSSSQPVECC